MRAKKLLSFLLSLALVFSLLPWTVLASGGQQYITVNESNFPDPGFRKYIRVNYLNVNPDDDESYYVLSPSDILLGLVNGNFAINHNSFGIKSIEGYQLLIPEECTGFSLEGNSDLEAIDFSVCPENVVNFSFSSTSMDGDIKLPPQTENVTMSQCTFATVDLTDCANIENASFYRFTSATKFAFPDKTSNFDNLSMSYCNELTDVNIPDSVKHVTITYCPKLVNLDTSKNPGLESVDVNMCDRLDKLDLKNNPEVKEITINGVAKPFVIDICDGDNLTPRPDDKMPTIDIKDIDAEDVIIITTPIPVLTPTPSEEEPEVTTTPEATVTPEVTVTPEATVTPVATVIPEVTATPTAPIVTVTPTINPSENVDDDGLTKFVKRCYSVILGREGEEDGVKGWVSKLRNGDVLGAHVGYGFVFSPEYLNLNKSNGDFVTDMYNMFFGRTPDQDGYKYWVDMLDEGASKYDIYAGFANSQEFYDLCSSFGIAAGIYLPGYDYEVQGKVNCFVDRLYVLCLGRHGDIFGQQSWAAQLIRNENTAAMVSYGFIFSQEFINSDLNDSDYLNVLYKAFMNREADDVGLNYWIDRLNSDMNRNDVFGGFIMSPEFTIICDDYSVIRGEI